MTQPVNLNRVRKQKARQEKKMQATQNVAVHGQSKASKALQKVRSDKAVRTLDGHRLDP